VVDPPPAPCVGADPPGFAGIAKNVLPEPGRLVQSAIADPVKANRQTKRTVRTAVINLVNIPPFKISIISEIRVVKTRGYICITIQEINALPSP
jgi:hypothetical protein